MANDFSDIWSIEETDIEDNISEYKWTIFGRAKSGKTTLATKMFTDPLIGQFERGAKAVVAKKVFFGSWLLFKRFVKELKSGYKEGKSIPFKEFVVDTADVAWKMCTKYICTQEGVDQVGDIPYGKGYDLLTMEFLEQMNELENMGISIVYISHDIDKEFKPKVGDSFSITQLSVPERCMAIIRDMPDFVVFLSSDKSLGEDGKIKITRRAYFRSDGDIACGSRLKFMPDFIEFTDEAELAIEIKKAFDKAVKLEKSKNEKDIENFLMENKEKTKSLQTVIKQEEIEEVEKEFELEENQELINAKEELNKLFTFVVDNKIVNKISFKKSMKNALGITDIEDATEVDEIFEFINEFKEKEGLD